MRTVCPKCESTNARYTKSQDLRDVVLTCMCGYHKVVATTLEEVTIEHKDMGKEVSLPRKESNLWYCLKSLCSLPNGVGSTQQIHSIMLRMPIVEQSMSEVSSQLTVLRYKGLVEVVESRKGVAGGSTWTLTEMTKKLTGFSRRN